MTKGDTCAFRRDPVGFLTKPNALLHTGAIREDHANIRAILSCATCGTLYAYDFMDSGEWFGEGDGQVIYVALSGQEKDDVLAMPRQDLLRLTPRLVLKDDALVPDQWDLK